MRVRLKCIVKKTPKEANCLIPAAAKPRLLHRGIVLIKQHNHFFSIIPFEIDTQGGNGHLCLYILHPFIYRKKRFSVILIKYVRLHNILEHCIKICNDNFYCRLQILNITSLYARKTQKYYRICSLQLPVFFIIPDFKAIKQISSACIFVWKKALQHAHIQRFSKSARTCNKRYRRTAFPPFFNKFALIYIKPVFFP